MGEICSLGPEKVKIFIERLKQVSIHKRTTVISRCIRGREIFIEKSGDILHSILPEPFLNLCA